MNPETYIHNDLGNICFNEAVKKGDKITIYEFDDEEQMAIIDFIRMMSNDYNLNVNEVLSRYIPDIESKKKETYTYLRAEKSHGDRWAVLLAEDGEERQINLSEAYTSFYSINSSQVECDDDDEVISNSLRKLCGTPIRWITGGEDPICHNTIEQTQDMCFNCTSMKSIEERPDEPRHWQYKGGNYLRNNKNQVWCMYWLKWVGVYIEAEDQIDRNVLEPTREELMGQK
jgi:hypothetical protein